LKTLEKINRKGNRNSRKKEKANSAQTSPLSPAPRACLCPRALGARQAGPACRRQPECTHSLSLSRCSVGPSYRHHSFPSPRPLSLSLCPAVPTCQSSLTSRPRSPHHGRCRRFDPGGSLDRRVNCRRVPQPRWIGARRSTKGGKPEGDRRKRGNPRPSCLSRAQVGCACSRGLQASAWEGARGLRARCPILPHAANPL
jgi:hypothetical protein